MKQIKETVKINPILGCVEFYRKSDQKYEKTILQPLYNNFSKVLIVEIIFNFFFQFQVIRDEYEKEHQKKISETNLKN